MRDRVIAHRGNAAQCRENSTAAVRSALELGCKYIEVDVQISSDGMPMMSHDVTLDRVFGKSVNINDTHSRDLRRIGVEQLCLASGLCEAHRAMLFVEIKRDSFERLGERAVTSAVSHANGYVFISFCLEAVLFARRFHGERIGWVVPDLSDRTLDVCDAVAPDYLFCDQLLIPRGQKLWPGQWAAYEVPTKAMAAELADCGVSLFETKNVKDLMC